ncbi:hypothetical protein [Pedobacter metabolipauper]|uniref:DUF1444 family protein n=1 Tax=Pedobacter metabolipauper TaxID=425513 RepID=A0A4R6SRU3_9SPHI|nr:hypothetical protein [Pedobacter metabolipauper]TDQ07172.1 hypothetical protein ATK78_4189 [Pedobacter metabolipauper]
MSVTRILKITTIVLLLAQVGCTNNQKNDYVFDEFSNQIEKHGMKIDSVDHSGLIYISKGELTLKVSLDNVRRDYERDKEKAGISNFVKTLVSYTIKIPSKWVDAKNNIYISLFPTDSASKDFLFQKITDEFGKVYVHVEDDKLSWIMKDDLKKWEITDTVLDRQANLNADSLLKTTDISFDWIEGHKLGRIESERGSLKGALLFAPAMKDKLKNGFGFPFYAVIPVRDFCYIFSEKDFDFFSKRIGKIVVDEYKKSGYPVSTEILKFTDSGIESAGKYPVE